MLCPTRQVLLENITFEALQFLMYKRFLALMKYGIASRRICLVHCWMVSRSWGWWSGGAGSIAANTDGEDPLWIVDADRG